MPDIDIDYSIVVPAYNEELLLNNCLRSLKEAMLQIDETGEIIVVDNNSTDQTAEIAKTAGAKVVFEPHRQIAMARNRGAKEARGKFLLFVDADTCISANILKEAIKNLKSGKVIGGGARVEFSRPPTGLARYLLRCWHLLSTSFKLAAGCFIFCKKDAFTEVGGFDTRVYASEEIWLSRNLRAYGQKRRQKFVILDMPGVTSSDRKNDQTMTLFLSMVVFFFFPAAVRFRRLCFLWYSCRNQRQ